MLLVLSWLVLQLSPAREGPHGHSRASPPRGAPSPHPRQTKTYRAPAFLATHWVNAFESDHGRLLHLDCAVTDSPALLSHWELGTGGAAPRRRLLASSWWRSSWWRPASEAVICLLMGRCAASPPAHSLSLCPACLHPHAVRAGPVGGKQIEDSVLRRLTIDLSREDGEHGCSSASAPALHLGPASLPGPVTFK